MSTADDKNIVFPGRYWQSVSDQWLVLVDQYKKLLHTSMYAGLWQRLDAESKRATTAREVSDPIHDEMNSF